MTFDAWLKTVKHIDNPQLAKAVRDRLYAEYSRGQSSKNKRKSRKANAQARALKTCESSYTNKSRDSWVINYLGYDYKTATNKQREYFNDDYRRYVERESFNVEQLSESDWQKIFAPNYDKCSEDMQETIHREYENFCECIWEYQPMSFETFIDLYEGTTIALLSYADTETVDAIYKYYFEFLHDVANASEDIWIDKFEIKIPSDEPKVTWEDLGIQTDSNGNPIRRDFYYRDIY